MALKRQTTAALASLPPEPFGRKLCRIREDVAEILIEDLARRISQWTPVSSATLSRLEHATEVPSRDQARLVATLFCIACGVDPAEVGLGFDDLPPAWDVPQVMQKLTSYSPCSTRRSIRLAA